MPLGPYNEIRRPKRIDIIRQVLRLDLGVAVDQKSELPRSTIQSYFDGMPFSLVPIISHKLDPLACEFFHDFPSTILTTIINDDYLIVLRYSFKLSIYGSYPSFDRVRFVVCGHDDGDSVLHKAFYEF